MNTFGKQFRISIFGESHGPYVGVTVDGARPGIPLSQADFAEDLLRRKAGAFGTTPRVEDDLPEIISGVFEGHTTGAPITILFRNQNTRSADYAGFREHPRPGHADFVANIKYGGFNDPRGGGHFSGRLTLGVVAAGVIAKLMLPSVRFHAAIVSLGGSTESSAWKGLLESAVADGDSLGAVVECSVDGLSVGLGEPFWDSVESLLAHAVFSIPGVRGIEFGDGFAASAMRGSEHNDPFPEAPAVATSEDAPAGLLSSGGALPPVTNHAGMSPVTNHAGGVNGGITNGNPLVFRVAFKPTSSIAAGGIPGRHDVCFALRTPVIVEAMAAIVLADLAHFSTDL